MFVDESVLNGIIKEYEDYVDYERLVKLKAELVKRLIYGAVFNNNKLDIANLPTFLAFTEQIGLTFRTLQGQ